MMMMMESKGSTRSITSTASTRRRRSTKKVISYSAKAIANCVLISTGAFVALALLGLSVQAYRFFKGNTPTIYPKSAPHSQNTAEIESLSSLAFAATVTAARLWGKLLMSILIPTTEHSLVYAREGWGALEPSLRQSAFWFLYDTTATFKLGVFLGFVGLFLIWLLEREIKRRRIVERVAARVKVVTDKVNSVHGAVKDRYIHVKAEVERESRIAAQLLPHILYIFLCGALIILFPEFLSQLSRGFVGWGIIVGWPVLMSSKKMIKHDEVTRARLKKLKPEDPTEFSSSDDEASTNEDENRSVASDSSAKRNTPKKKAEVMVESMVQYVRKRLLSDASLSSPIVTYGLNSENVYDYDPITEWLRYWSVLSICLFLEQFPFTGHFISIIPVWPEMRLAFALWLELPITRGCDFAFSMIVPLLDRYVKKIPALQLAQTQMGALNATNEGRGIVISLLSSVGIINKKTGKKLLKATETNGTLILVSLPFMISPSFVTKIGVLVIGLAFPAHASTTCVLEIENFKSSIKKHDPNVADETGQDEHHLDAGEAAVFWLEYWVVYVLFSLIHAPLASLFGWWFPLWDQLHLAILLWMQVSYFSGAHNIFRIFVVVGRVWRRRRRAALRQRRRTSSVPTPHEKLEDIVSAIPLLSPLVSSATRPSMGDDDADDDSHSDQDPNTDTDDLGHDITDERSIKLAGGDKNEGAGVLDASHERRHSSRHTETHSFASNEVDEADMPAVDNAAPIGDDDFVNVEKNGSE